MHLANVHNRYLINCLVRYKCNIKECYHPTAKHILVPENACLCHYGTSGYLLCQKVPFCAPFNFVFICKSGYFKNVGNLFSAVFQQQL